jgi:hypothetical protein
MPGEIPSWSLSNPSANGIASSQTSDSIRGLNPWDPMRQHTTKCDRRLSRRSGSWPRPLSSRLGQRMYRWRAMVRRRQAGSRIGSGTWSLKRFSTGPPSWHAKIPKLLWRGIPMVDVRQVRSVPHYPDRLTLISGLNSAGSNACEPRSALVRRGRDRLGQGCRNGV